MASRSKERRRTRGERAAVLRTHTEVASLPAVQHGARAGGIQWRAISGLIVVSLLVVLMLFFASDAFYVHTISVAGIEYLRDEEIFRWADIANIHIFWVDADKVRASLMNLPSVADAQVTLGWPPSMVRISIQERQPALIWEQADVQTWVDIQGNILMIPPVERPDLLRVIVEDIAIPVHPDQVIPPSVVSGALQLRALLPNLPTLRYHQDYGLGFVDPAGWQAWFGDGRHMDEKIQIYRALVARLQEQGITPEYITILSPDAPYYCARPGGC